MSTRPIISVVIPIKDEQDVILELYARLQRTLDAIDKPWEAIFVNDGSIDNTQRLLEELQASNPQIRIVELATNFGQTAALAAGIDYALGEIIITMDGDLQHEPEYIPKFLLKINEGYDIVVGWRKDRDDALFSRRLPSRVANYLTRKLTGITIRDLGSTYKAAKADFIKQLELFGDMHRFIPVLAGRLGAKITEIPIQIAPRKSGKSKYGLGRAPGVFQDIVFLLFYSRYITRPLRFFGMLFFAFAGSGFLIALTMLILVWLGMIVSVNNHQGMLLFAVFLMVMGMQFLMTGILAELISRIYVNTGKQKIYFVRNFR